MASRHTRALGIGCAIVASLALQGTQPAAPSNLWAAQTSPREITLTWTRVPGAARYRIFEGAGDAAKLLGQTSASANQYIRPVSAFGVEHRFSIEAIHQTGEVSARVSFNPVVPREVTPGPVASPAAVTARAGQDGISITWDAVTGATGYRIARQIAPGGFQILCYLCSTETSFRDATAQPGGRHVYTVAAVAPMGVSRPVRSSEVVALADQTVSPPAGRILDTAVDTAPRGTITVPPVPGGCLAIGEQGNVIVRAGDGTVRFFERVHFERGMSLVPNPAFTTVPGISTAVAARTSGPHSLVLLADGTLRTFGKNDRGQLGTRGGYTSAPTPVPGITNAVDIAVGEGHSAAVLADGTLRVWGATHYGVAGQSVLPGPVAEITNAKSITAGVGATFVLLADGTVRAWGKNFGGFGFYGVLGTGETVVATSAPRPVIGVSNAVAVSTSGVSSLALLANGRVMAWGAARDLRRDQQEDFLHTGAPRAVPGITNAIAVSPYLILLADGSVRELFNPETRVAGIENAVAVASDPTNKYALLADGRLIGWGLKQWWPKGMVTVAEFGAKTASECRPARRSVVAQDFSPAYRF